MTVKQYAHSILNAVKLGATQYTEADILEALQHTGDL